MDDKVLPDSKRVVLPYPLLLRFSSELTQKCPVYIFSIEEKKTGQLCKENANGCNSAKQYINHQM